MYCRLRERIGLTGAVPTRNPSTDTTGLVIQADGNWWI
jgi:hypothetical protein